jgi:hypothetical protein
VATLTRSSPDRVDAGHDCPSYNMMAQAWGNVSIARSGTLLACLRRVSSNNRNAGNVEDARWASRGHSAALLPNGKVLVAAGNTGLPWQGVAVAGDFNSAGAMVTPRSQRTATLLANGKGFIVGGTGNSGNIAMGEPYDSTSGQFTSDLSGISRSRAFAAAAIFARRRRSDHGRGLTDRSILRQQTFSLPTIDVCCRSSTSQRP